jgi:hypothetical protein
VTVALYFDVQVPYASATGLRLRGVDVLTAQEDGGAQLLDPALLDRASVLQRVVFTMDRDFLREAARRQQMGQDFAGVIYAYQLLVTIGQCVHDLEIVAKVEEPETMVNQVLYLPLS